MRFHELDDYKGFSKDVSGIGHWGNGDVELRFNRLDDLPYVMSLVRQAFEIQMGNGILNKKEAMFYQIDMSCIPAVKLVVRHGKTFLGKTYLITQYHPSGSAILIFCRR
jgi:hypothetical protein